MTKLELENLLSDRKVELADPETVKNYVVDLHHPDATQTTIPGDSCSSPYCTLWWAVEDLNL